MFEANQRQNFIDLLRPPPGYRLESAVGTTYSLDFVALTATLLALVDADAESEEAPATQIDCLHAITRLADRVRIFVNRGQIAGPRTVSRVTVLYSTIVHEVCLPEGCFHPKVWIIHYRPRKSPGTAERPGIVRVICASRNLTISQCWEAFVAFEGEEQKSKIAGSLNAGVRDFLSRLAAHVPEESKQILRVRDALVRTTFDLPRPLQKEASFLWQWHGGQGLREHLPPKGKGQRALVISPFVRQDFLEDILSRFDQIILVSSQRELDRISDSVLMTRICNGKNRAFVVWPVDTEDSGTAMDLHAKVLVLEDAKGSKTLLGSANASRSAWTGHNCEALIQFSPGVSIDHFCDRFIFGDERAKRGGRRPLRGWISEYQRQELVEDEQDRAEQHLDEICDAISRLELLAHYEPELQCLRVTIATISPHVRANFSEWESTYQIRVALLSHFHSDAALQRLAALMEGAIQFVGVQLSDLTEFLIVQVAHGEFGIERRFILKAKADFSKWREQRDVQLLQQLLTRESLRAFLEAILFDAAIRPPLTTDDLQSTGNGTTPSGGVLSELSIEEVIRSCTEDTSRIDEINRVLRAFEKTEWIDQEFRQFWDTFVAAEAEARGAATLG